MSSPNGVADAIFASKQTDCLDARNAAADAASSLALLDTLEAAFHARQSEWLFLRELRVGTGRQNRGGQRLDAFALNTLPHQAMRRVCYEIKVSRADFLCEMRHPLKRRIGMRYSNEFYFVTPAGLLDTDEVPLECGLIEIGKEVSEERKSLIEASGGLTHFNPQTGMYCLMTITAPWRDTPGPTWQFAAAMLRHQRRTLEEKRQPPPKQQHLNFEPDSE